MQANYLSPTQASQLNAEFASNYYLSDEYGRECDECRNRRMSLSQHEAIRAKWQAKFTQRTGHPA